MKNFCPAVSVIIPLYNAEKYISECLDSILAQTFTDFEVIVVDDCSIDSSCAIVESYAEKFGERLTLSRLEKNSGNGALPRNEGLILSRGEYIFFADNDDSLTKTALEEMYTLAKKYDADVVYCEKIYETNDDGKNIRVSSRQSGIFVNEPTFETENLAERVQGVLQWRFGAPPWIKLIKRNLLIENKIYFPSTVGGEDIVWTWGLVFYAKKFLRVPNPVYIKRLAKSSIMQREKTRLQQINFCLNSGILGIKSLENFMSKLEFFRANPDYRYAVLEYFIRTRFDDLFNKTTFENSSFEIYETIKQEFGDRFGEWDVLISALCAILDTQKKIINSVNVRQFNEFTTQAKERIDELEQRDRVNKAYIAELENFITNLIGKD